MRKTFDHRVVAVRAGSPALDPENWLIVGLSSIENTDYLFANLLVLAQKKLKRRAQFGPPFVGLSHRPVVCKLFRFFNNVLAIRCGSRSQVGV